MHVSKKHGLLYIVTKFGFLFIYEINNCVQIIKSRISQDSLFTGSKNTKSDGILVINKAGSLLSVDIDEKNIVSYISNNCQNIPDNAAFKLASRYGLRGADQMFL